MAVQDVSTLQQRLEKQKGKRALERKTMTMTGGFNAATGGAQKTTDVSEIAGGMMQEDNPLMTRAKTQGAQVANRRGMLNSSAAAGESMNAVLDKIVPMASQEAQQRHSEVMSDKEAGHRWRENEQQYGFASALSSQEADQRSDLSFQEYEQASLLSDQDFEQQMGLSKEEYRQQLEIQSREHTFERGQAQRAFQQEDKMQKRQLASERQLARMDSQTRQKLMRMESDMRERLAQIDVDQQTRAGMSDMVTSMNSQYQNALNSILGNPNLPADEREALLQNAGELLNLQVDLVSDLFDTKIDWAGGNFDITAPAQEEDDQEDDNGSTNGSSSSSSNTTEYLGP
jgi:hypothetical protein